MKVSIAPQVQYPKPGRQLTLFQTKCSRSEPCRNCEKARVPCEYRQVDQKRKPASQDHVNILQNRVAWLEGFISDLKKANNIERSAKLQSIDFLPPPSSSVITPPEEAALGSGHSTIPRSTNFHVTNDGSLSFHGRTSIYQVMFEDHGRSVEDASNNLSSAGHYRNADYVLQHFDIDINDDVITQVLVLFFKWQYSNFVFIYRDAFLQDHYGTRQDSKYWSLSLLLSVCALGSLMLPDSERHGFGQRCHDAAESIAMVTDLVNPSITAVQTFLCLAFYDIGVGSLSKGWAFSGKAALIWWTIGQNMSDHLRHCVSNGPGPGLPARLRTVASPCQVVQLS